MVIKLPNKRKVREDYDNDKDENEVVVGLEPGHVHNTIFAIFNYFIPYPPLSLYSIHRPQTPYLIIQEPLVCVVLTNMQKRNYPLGV
jgi:hypothetical protein